MGQQQGILLKTCCCFRQQWAPPPLHNQKCDSSPTSHYVYSSSVSRNSDGLVYVTTDCSRQTSDKGKSNGTLKIEGHRSPSPRPLKPQINNANPYYETKTITDDDFDDNPYYVPKWTRYNDSCGLVSLTSGETEYWRREKIDRLYIFGSQVNGVREPSSQDSISMLPAAESANPVPPLDWPAPPPPPEQDI